MCIRDRLTRGAWIRRTAFRPVVELPSTRARRLFVKALFHRAFLRAVDRSLPANFRSTRGELGFATATTGRARINPRAYRDAGFVALEASPVLRPESPLETRSGKGPYRVVQDPNQRVSGRAEPDAPRRQNAPPRFEGSLACTTRDYFMCIVFARAWYYNRATKR